MAPEIKNLTPLQTDLIEIAKEATRSDILKVAADIDLDPSTVYDYLKGKVAKESRGRAIHTKLRKTIDKRIAA